MTPNHLEKILHDIKRNSEEDNPTVCLSLSNGDNLYDVMVEPLDITWDLLVASKENWPPFYIPTAAITYIWVSNNQQGVG